MISDFSFQASTTSGAEYRLPFIFGQKLRHPAARSLCDSWASCVLYYHFIDIRWFWQSLAWINATNSKRVNSVNQVLTTPQGNRFSFINLHWQLSQLDTADDCYVFSLLMSWIRRLLGLRCLLVPSIRLLKSLVQSARLNSTQFNCLSWVGSGALNTLATTRLNWLASFSQFWTFSVELSSVESSFQSVQHLPRLSTTTSLSRNMTILEQKMNSN